MSVFIAIYVVRLFDRLISVKQCVARTFKT